MIKLILDSGHTKVKITTENENTGDVVEAFKKAMELIGYNVDDYFIDEEDGSSMEDTLEDDLTIAYMSGAKDYKDKFQATYVDNKFLRTTIDSQVEEIKQLNKDYATCRNALKVARGTISNLIDKSQDNYRDSDDMGKNSELYNLKRAINSVERMLKNNKESCIIYEANTFSLMNVDVEIAEGTSLIGLAKEDSVMNPVSDMRFKSEVYKHTEK